MTSNRGRLATTVLSAVALSCAAGTAAQAQQDPSIFVNVSSRQDKAADERFGKEYHEGLRDLLENRMFNGLKSAYPCIHYLDMSAAIRMIGVEKMRELLGGQGDSRLPALAGAVGAGHLGNVSVTVMGGTVVVSGSLMDSAAARAIGRAQVTAPAGDSKAIEAAMDKFVSRLVASAGADGPKCSRWQGEITATTSQHDRGKNPSGEPYSLDVDLKISCQIGTGDRDAPTCQLSYSNALDGKDASTTTTASGPARCNAGLSLQRGKAKITLSSCQVEGTTRTSVAGYSATDKQPLSLGGWEHEFAVSASTRTLSGSVRADKATTLGWNLTWK